VGGAIGGILGAVFLLAMVAASMAPSLLIPGPYRVVRLIVMWLGLAIPNGSVLDRSWTHLSRYVSME
jgi:hypothetical protein